MSREAYVSLLAAIQADDLASVRREVERGALRPLKRGEKHARALRERLLEADSPEIAEELVQAGAFRRGDLLAAALGRSPRIARRLQGLRPEGPVTRFLSALPMELSAVLYAGLAAALAIGQLLLADWIAPGWLEWASALSGTGAALACLSVSLLGAGLLSLGVFAALERAGW